MRQLVRILAIVGALLASGADAATPLPRPACPPGQAPRFVQFAALQEQLGAAMGSPIECERANPQTGDRFQQTTTGLAFYDRATATPTFTAGTEHWALTAAGLTQWTGGWHAGLLPPGAAGPPSEPPDAQVPPPSTYPILRAATVVRRPDPAGATLVVGHAGARYRIEGEAGCLADAPDVGEPVFVLSPDAFAEPGALLITAVRGRECPILAGRQLP